MNNKETVEKTQEKSQEEPLNKLVYKREIVQGLVLATVARRDSEEGSLTRSYSLKLIDHYLDLCKQEKIILFMAKVDSIISQCPSVDPDINRNGDVLYTMLPRERKYWPTFIDKRKVYLSNAYDKTDK